MLAQPAEADEEGAGALAEPGVFAVQHGEGPGGPALRDGGGQAAERLPLRRKGRATSG
ncbi:hypothetical protein [Streptomyces sp. BBFR102]|uniref:hypothetical protein n=1 Tax=Streptomyces sp. BBFR102 TaxID=3448171 RepID=UPI003F53A776